MSTLPAAKPDGGTSPGEESPPQLAATIGRAVIAALGRPADFYRVSVFRLWEDTYRVNVLTGTDPSALAITHSYFVSSDGMGNVVRSTPPLARRY